MEKYSLWIIPPPSVKKKLEDSILALSQEYKAPVFEPHMTLIGDVDMDKETAIQKANKVAKTIHPLKLTFSEVSFSTTYFQSVFARVKSTADVMNANVYAKKVFGLENNLFMPHISLLYGEHTMKVREEIANKLIVPTALIEANTMVLVPSASNPAGWLHIEEFILR